MTWLFNVGVTTMAKFTVQYEENSSFSDGELENELYDFWKNDRDIDRLISHDPRIITTYHVSPMRSALLSWYPFKEGASIVEIGGGMGSITGVLCSKGSRVVSIEPSISRARVLFERHKEYENLEVVVSDLEHFSWPEKFDYVVVVGILEYQGNMGDGSENPYAGFIKSTRDLIKDDGKLLLAIENRFGIKYFCGAPEDHTKIPFDGIRDYPLGGKACTFSKNELDDLLLRNGYKHSFYYYPMPNYLLPQVVWSDDYMPSNEYGLAVCPYYPENEGEKSLLADERLLYKYLLNNRLFGFFANSFLVEARNTDHRGNDVIYASLSSDRKKQYQTCTTILDSKKVEKYPIYPEGFKQITNCHMFSEEINHKKSELICALSNEVKDKKIIMDYCDYPSLLNVLINCVEFQKYRKLEELIDNYYAAVLSISEVVENENNWLVKNGYGSDDLEFGPIVKKLYIELTPSNCFVDENGKLFAFDVEMAKDFLPAKYMIFRALEYLVSISHLYNLDDSWCDSVKRKYRLSEVWDIYRKYTEDYYHEIRDDNHIALSEARKIDRRWMIDNSNHIIDWRKNVDEIQTLKMKVNQTLDENEVLEKRCEQLNETIENRRTENTNLHAELSALQEKYNLCKGELLSLQAEYDNFTNQELFGFVAHWWKRFCSSRRK